MLTFQHKPKPPGAIHCCSKFDFPRGRTISLLPRPHPLINLQLPREGLVTLATKTVASTSQNREVASRLQRANPSRHYCLTYNVTVLIRKFTKLRLLKFCCCINYCFAPLWLVSVVLGCSLRANKPARMNRRRLTLERRLLVWAGRHVTIDTKNFLERQFLSRV